MIVLFGAASARAQQRPLLTEDPRLPAEGVLVTELGFKYQHHAFAPASGLRGDLYSFFDTGLHFGLGDRSEFQMTGVVQDYMRIEDSSETRNDWGNLALSMKIKILDEGGAQPIVTFRPTIVLPNSSQTKGINTDGTNFFASLLLGKSVGSAFVYGSIGIGIIDDSRAPAAQQDVLAYGIAAAVPVSSRVTLVSEWNGRTNRLTNFSPGAESLAQVRLGLQVKTAGLRWDAAATAGVSHWEHRVGFAAGVSREFRLWR